MPHPVAVITGAGRGIGRAVAIELGRCGYRLGLAARTQDELAETARQAGGEMCLSTDVADPVQTGALIDQIHHRFGRVDALVHAAGLAPALPVDQMSIDQWRQVIEVNLSSAFYLSRAVWPMMKQQHGGVIVFVSSFASRDPFPGFAAYGAAKAGLNVLAMSLAREGHPHGIRVHTVAPSAVETQMFRQLRTLDEWPTSKTLDPADVAQVITRCVTGELRHTSGEVIFLSRTV